MERATALFRLRFAGERADRAMIGNRDPGKDRYRDDQATRGCFHNRFNRRLRANAQMFSF
jgi:hypothetical protein